MLSVYSRYKDWVRRNNSLLSVWETGLSSLTWILPDRFSESELALEVFHTAINLVSTFHDSIINESTSSSGESRGTELVFLLGAMQQVQVLVELGASLLERKGHGNRYDALTVVEGLKALLRMVILYRSDSRILTNGGLTNFEQWAARGVGLGQQSADARAHQVVDAFAQFRNRHCKLDGSSQAAQSNVQPQYGSKDQSILGCCSCGPEREGEVNQKLGLWWQMDDQGSCLLAEVAKVQPVGRSSGDGDSDEAIRAAESWAAARQTLAMRMIIAGEILHILRPMVYTMALRKWGRVSWRPWLTSLVFDLLSGQLTSGGARLSQNTAQRASSNPALKGSSAVLLLRLQGIRWSVEERDELTRRKLLLVYFLLRDPLFARYTGPAIQRWQRLMGKVPLAGWVTDKVVEILMGMQQYYTYTAAS